MKQIKNAWLLMIGSFLVMATIIISCSKKGTAPPVVPKPTITSFSPTSASAGDTVIITGTNFTGATVVSFGGSAATSFSIVSATSISAKVGSGATGSVSVVTPGGTATLAGFTLNAPRIDGYNNSNEVAVASLKAHWTFDDTKTEVISTKDAEKTVGTTAFSTAVIGKGIDLTNAYMIFPEIPNLDSIDALPNFTMSLWAKFNVDSLPTLSSLFQINGVNFQDIWPMVGVATRINPGGIYSLAAGDTHVDATGTHPTYDALFLNPGVTPSEGFSAGTNGWAFITVVYDGPSRTMSYYGNGVFLGNRVATNIPGALTTTLALLTPAKVSFGTFEFIDDFPDGIYGHPPAANTIPWAAHGITGSLDDVRVFNSALSNADVKALYDLGIAGR